MSQPENGNALLERDLVVRALHGQLARGEEGLSAVPKTLERVLVEESWRDRIDTHTRERFTFAHFAEFVTAPPLAGLGADVDLVQRLVRGTPTERLVRDALRRRSGGQTTGEMALDDVHARFNGNRRGYLLGRLHRERPDLLARVDAGEISAYAAAVEAGFRRRTVTLCIDTADDAVRALLRRFPPAELRAALDRVEAER